MVPLYLRIRAGVVQHPTPGAEIKSCTFAGSLANAVDAVDIP